MKKNMGLIDRILRLVVSTVFATLYFTNTVSGVFGIVLLVLAGVFTLTSIISFCPLYSIVGFSTCPVENK